MAGLKVNMKVLLLHFFSLFSVCYVNSWNDLNGINYDATDPINKKIDMNTFYAAVEFSVLASKTKGVCLSVLCC